MRIGNQSSTIYTNTKYTNTKYYKKDNLGLPQSTSNIGNIEKNAIIQIMGEFVSRAKNVAIKDFCDCLWEEKEYFSNILLGINTLLNHIADIMDDNTTIDSLEDTYKYYSTIMKQILEKSRKERDHFSHKEFLKIIGEDFSFNPKDIIENEAKGIENLIGKVNEDPFTLEIIDNNYPNKVCILANFTANNKTHRTAFALEKGIKQQYTSNIETFHPYKVKSFYFDIHLDKEYKTENVLKSLISINNEMENWLKNVMINLKTYLIEKELGYLLPKIPNKYLKNYYQTKNLNSCISLIPYEIFFCRSLCCFITLLILGISDIIPWINKENIFRLMGVGSVFFLIVMIRYHIEYNKLKNNLDTKTLLIGPFANIISSIYNPDDDNIDND